MRLLPIFLAVLALLGWRSELVAEDFAEMNQHEMNAAAEKSAEQADKQLNVVYKKVMAALDAEGKALLKVSQRAWLTYRDAEASFAADAMRGGSAAPLLYFGAMSGLTKARTRELEESLEAIDGNAAE